MIYHENSDFGNIFAFTQTSVPKKRIRFGFDFENTYDGFFFITNVFVFA